MQLLLKYAFNKASSILQMQKNVEITGKKKYLGYRSEKPRFLSSSCNTGDFFFLVSVCS